MTITSLELPESSIPLIDSQASARSRGTDESPRTHPDGDVILDEFLEKVSNIGRDKSKDGTRICGIADGSKRGRRDNGKRNRCNERSQCKGDLASLEECTQNIVEGNNLFRFVLVLFGVAIFR